MGSGDNNNFQLQTNATGRVTLNGSGSAMSDATGTTGTFTVNLNAPTGVIYGFTSETSSGFGRAAANTPAIYSSSTEVIRATRRQQRCGATKYLVWFNGSNWTVVGK
jgi:hypothetical protein